MTMAPADLRAWALSAQRGDSVVYHRGDVGLAQPNTEEGRSPTGYRFVRKHLGGFCVPLKKFEQIFILDSAAEASILEIEGLVKLAQRRLGEHDYEYIAQRTKKVSLAEAASAPAKAA